MVLGSFRQLTLGISTLVLFAKTQVEGLPYGRVMLSICNALIL
jgi:hypothetical protein